MRASVFFAFSLVISCLLRCAPAQAQEQASCEQVPGYETVRFIAGDWGVFFRGDEEHRYRVGVNRIHPTDTGCAFSERWKSIAGTEGEGLFYYSPSDSVWKQIVVTKTEGLRSGEMYEKALVRQEANGLIRFEGEAISQSGTAYLERSTYTPLPDGNVHFVLEASNDEGATWQTSLDTVLVPLEDTEM